MRRWEGVGRLVDVSLAEGQLAVRLRKGLLDATELATGKKVGKNIVSGRDTHGV